MYPSPCVDHQHHLNQKNPSTTARENESQLVIDFKQKTAVAPSNKNQDDAYEMTLEEQIQQYEDEQFAAEDRAEEAAWPISKWEKAAAILDASLYKLIKNAAHTTAISPTEIPPKFNTDDKFTATTTTTEEEKEISTTAEEKLGTPTTTGIEKEEKVRKTIDDETIEDEFATSTTTEEREEKEEGRTTIDHECYTTSTTINEISVIVISDSTVERYLS